MTLRRCGREAVIVGEPDRTDSEWAVMTIPATPMTVVIQIWRHHGSPAHSNGIRVSAGDSVNVRDVKVLGGTDIGLVIAADRHRVHDGPLHCHGQQQGRHLGGRSCIRHRQHHRHQQWSQRRSELGRYQDPEPARRRTSTVYACLPFKQTIQVACHVPRKFQVSVCSRRGTVAVKLAKRVTFRRAVRPQRRRAARSSDAIR